MGREIITPKRSTGVVLVALCAGLALVGCTTRGMTKPRSEVVNDAASAGISMPSAEEERAQFEAAQEEQSQRLLALIAQRARGALSTDPSYRLGAGDEVGVNVFDVPELNTTVRINQGGLISLPLVGAVQASGLTEAEFKAELTKRLAHYVRNPQVSVFVSGFGSQKISVVGSVSKPGTYSLQKNSASILEVLGEAGGLTNTAANYINFVPAEISGIGAANDVEARARFALAGSSPAQVSAQAIEVPLDRILGTAGNIPIEVPIRGGDMIVVPEAGSVVVDGEVQKIGTYDLGRRMTVLGALAAAGGITYGAKVDEVEVVREFSNGQKASLVLNLEKIARGEDADPKLRNGDLVRVPSDSGRRLTQDTFESISQIVKVGVGGTVDLIP